MKRTLRSLFLALLCALTLLIAVSAAPSAVSAPARVENFAFERSGAESIKLTWTPLQGAEGYVVYQQIAGTSRYQRVAKCRASSWTVTGLTADTVYTFAIRAYVTADGKELLSPTFPVLEAATAAPAVTDLACEVDEGAFRLSWSPSESAEGYYVYCDEGSGWRSLGMTAETTFDGELYGDAEKYTFGVKTYTLFNDRRYISTDLVTVNYYTIDPPAAVEGLRFVRMGSDSIQLQWTPDETADGYEIYQKKAGASRYTMIAKGAPDGEYTADELAPDTRYQFAVRAYRTAGGDDLLSPTYPVITAQTMPPKVTGLKATVTTSVSLSWNASKGAEGYYVYYKLATGGWHEYGRTTTASFKKDLPADVTRFYFGVKSYRTIGGKRYISTDLTSVRCDTPTRPATVTGFALKSVGANSLQLKWTYSKNVDGYVIYEKKGSGSYRRILKKNFNGTCTVTGLSQNTSYHFAIRAYRTVNGAEVLSMKYPEIAVTTMAPRVKGLSVTFSEERSYSRWKASPGADGYLVYYNTGSGWVHYGTTTTTWFRKRALTPATEHTFGVKTYKMVNGKRVISSDITTVKGSTLPVIPNYTFTKKNNVYTLKWSAVAGADYYLVYSQVPGGKWICRATTRKLTASFTLKNTPKLYLAVRPAMKYGSTVLYGDFAKKLVTDRAPSGSVYTFGDSIAKGTGSHQYAYAEIFAERHNLTVYRRTISSSSLCSALDSKHICEEVINCVKPGSKYTYIMIEGGRNDYYYNCAIGRGTPAGTKRFDMNTVCGALEAAFTHIMQNSPASRVIFVMMHDAGNQSQIANESGFTFEDYANAISAVCAKYGVEVADVMSTGFNTGNKTICNRYTYHYFDVFPEGDAVHPTQTGYELFYLPVIETAARAAKPINPSYRPTEPPTEPVTEPETEPLTEPETEAPTEPVTESATDPTDAPDHPTDPAEPPEPSAIPAETEPVYEENQQHE